MIAKPPDFPLSDIAAECEREIADGGFILQKWTCDGCGERVTATNVNTLTHAGHCQNCNHVTNLDERGCNYMLVKPSRPATVAEIEQALGLAAAGIH